MWIRGRSLRPGRTDVDDEFQLDFTKDCAENIRDILTNICKKQGIASERRRLSYLNAFVKLLTNCEHDYSKLGFTAEEILYCLRPALLHDTTQVRSGGLRALRYMLRTKHEAAICVKLQCPLLVARSLDLITGNDNERVQAIRVVRRLMCLNAAQFPVSLARTLVAIASGTEDRLINVTLAALAELCVLNPELGISVGGVTTILRSLASVRSARMAEALVGSLLYLQNKPSTRLRAALSLDCLAAPYTDLQAGDKIKDNQGWDRLKWPHVTLLSTLRSWPGVLHFCHPLKDGLKSIVATLYLNQLDVRKAVLDLLYQLLCLAQPEWSDEMSVALEAVDPSRTQEAFKLSEGFVAAEGKAVLPHLSKCSSLLQRTMDLPPTASHGTGRRQVNLSELHLSLLLYCFLEVGLLDAIVEVIIAEDTFLSVRATILLGELLHLIHLLLPPECCHLTPSLPNLLSYAVRGRPHSAPRTGYGPDTPDTILSPAHSNSDSFPGPDPDPPMKKDMLLINRMGVRSGHSSVRTVSESSTDRAAKPDAQVSDLTEKRTGHEEVSPSNSHRKDSISNKQKPRGDQTAHLLKDVREVLSDMTNSDIKSPLRFAPRSRRQTLRHSESEREGVSASFTSTSSSSQAEPPHCSRAQQRALAAVTALSRLHRLMRQRPAPASIHLDHVLACVTGRPALDGIELARIKGKTHSKSKLTQALTKECDEAIKDSQVLTNKDCFSWNWEVIRAILKSRPECLRKCEDSSHRQFMRRLIQFVLPSSRQMSRVDFSTDRRVVNNYTLAAMELLDCLLLGQLETEQDERRPRRRLRTLSSQKDVDEETLRMICIKKVDEDSGVPDEVETNVLQCIKPQGNSECEKLLNELLVGVKTQFEAISSAKSAHDCLFSPQAVGNTLCQDYFLLVGHITRSKAGCDLLDKMGIIHVLLVLATTSKHDCYIKLIISSLDYSSDERIRNIMSSTLVCSQVSSRLYATKFLRVLLRTPLTKRPDYAGWVIELLANQLSDENRAVSLCAVTALDEACDCKEYLEALINLRPSLLHLGDKGLLLLIRFLSTEKGFKYMNEANFVSTQLAKWVKFNYKYVCIVEGELADGLTLVERNEDGRYSSRLSHNKRVPGDVFVPPHLYGQLARHQAGFNALLADENIPKLLQVVLQGLCSTDSEILDLKAALWALGHLSSSPTGALWARAHSVTRAFVSLCCTSPVYSIRSTAFHVIALTATNTDGADTLRSLGWHTVRHNRSQHWPVVAPLSMLEDALIQYQEDKYMNRDSSESTNTDTVTRNGLFVLGEDSSVEGNDSFVGFTAQERAARERKAATLPPAGSGHTYHHNRSYSESKADCDWPRSNTPAPSNSGSDITDFRSHENSRLYSESSTSGASSCGESSSGQPRTYISERLMQTLSPIPSSDSLATIRSRRISITSSQGPQLSPQDVAGYNAIRNLTRSRRLTLFPSLHLPLHYSQSAPPTLSPLSPIELIAFQDWRQMSPLVRPKHPDNHPVEPQFEVSGIHCPLPGDSHSPQALHYESSRACIAQPPEDPDDEDTNGPCYQGICLPQHLIDLFPLEEISVKVEDPLQDNNSTTGMDVSSCEGSETDTAGEVDGEHLRPRGSLPKRHHIRTSCLLCSVARLATPRQPRWRKISASSQHRIRTETESSYGGVGNDGESPVMLPWQNKGGLEGITSVDSSSTDITSVAQRSLGDNFKSRSVVRKEILRLAEQLCNPILYKTCKQALLQLKQMYGDVFNDICVYSDVCAIMASAPHRIYARRFLQELFLDAPFSEMYEDPLGILSVPNNAESGEEGTFGEKLSLGSEGASTEDQIIEANNWKPAGPKMNGFDSDPRAGQSYELEVILESDARSESSDICRGSGEGGRGHTSTVGSRGSITPLDPTPRSLHGNSTNDKGGRPLHNADEDWSTQSPPVMPHTIAGEVECHITVSRSSQQLRKEFFNSTLSSESTSFEKDNSFVPTETKSAKKCDESFVTKVADSISKSQGLLEGKVQIKHAEEPKFQVNLLSTDMNSMSSDKKSEMQQFKAVQEDNHAPEVKTKLNDSSPKLTRKLPEKREKLLNQESASRDSTIPVNNTNKSPKPVKKGKKINNSKPSTQPVKSEASSTKTVGQQISTLNIELSNQGRDSVSPKLRKEVKVDSSVVKKELTKNSMKLPVFCDSVDTSTSSSKHSKSKPNEASSSSGKPPTGLGRQRKKGITKTPNKDSLESIKRNDTR